jgi:hypothetical protein
MAKRRNDDWMNDELWPRLKSRGSVGSLVFWFIIWAICNFNPWVGIGLFFAAGGSIGVFGGGKRVRHDDMLDWDDEEDDDRPQARGGETRDSARARTGSEVGAESALALELHEVVTADAQAARTKLEAAASVADGELGARLRNMLSKVKEVEAGLKLDPSRLSDVQRLFTYYLPATADLLAARGALVGGGDSARLAEIDKMIGKLDLAYTDFADRLKGHDARSLEIDLRLLDQALNDEFVVKSKG